MGLFGGNRRNNGGLLGALLGRPQPRYYNNQRNYRNPLVGMVVSGLVSYGISRLLRNRMNGGRSASIWGGSDNIQGAGGGSTWNPNGGYGGGSTWDVGNEPSERF